MSLLDMIHFFVPKLTRLAGNLARFGVHLDYNRNLTGVLDQNRQVTPGLAHAEIIKMFDQTIETCKELGLRTSVMEAERIKGYIEHPNPDIPVIIDSIEDLGARISDELTAFVCFFLPPEKISYYDTPNPFGEEVSSHFSSANFDIEEASKCFAMARYTACAFHLFRAVEIGLKTLAVTLGAPVTVPSWDGILKKIDTELIKDYKNKTPNWKQEEDFYAEAALHIRNYKNSRNNTQHAEKKYTEEEALRIYNAVRGLMQHLATKLKENEKEN